MLSRSDFTNSLEIPSDNVFLRWVTSGTNTREGFEIRWIATLGVKLYASKTYIPLGGTSDINIAGGKAPYSLSIESGEGSLTGQVYTASSTKGGLVKIKVVDSNAASFTKEVYVYEPLAIPASNLCYTSSTSESIGRIYDNGGASNYYLTGESCGYLIDIPTATSIVLESISFSTAQIGDYLLVYEGADDTGTLLGRFHENDNLKGMEIPSNQVYLKWVESGSDNSAGFELIYHAKNTNENLLTSYYLPPSSSMRVHSLRDTTSLNYSVLSGSSSFSDNNLSSTSSQETLSIELDDSLTQVTSSVSVVDPSSLSASLMCTDSSSSDAIGRVFDSGGSVSNYSNSEDCGFLIAPTGASTVYLNPISFNSFSSTADWLEIYDGSDDTGSLIGRYFTNDLQYSGPIKAKSGSMYLKWHSNSSNSNSGFELLWTSD